MQIKTAFNIGDEIFFMHNSAPRKSVVSKITTESNLSLQGVRTEICYSTSIREVYEYQAYGSITELMEALQEQADKIVEESQD